MLVLIAVGMLVWIFSCVVVVCVCAMAARGDGRPMRRTSSVKAAAATTHFIVR